MTSIVSMCLSMMCNAEQPPPPPSGNLLGGPDLTSKKFQKFSANGTPPLASVYARFRAFGPGNSISIICMLAAEEATSHVGS